MIEMYRDVMPEDIKEELLRFETENNHFSYAFQNVPYFNFYNIVKNSNAYCFVNRHSDHSVVGFLMCVVVDSYRIGKWGKRCIVYNSPIAIESEKLTKEQVLGELLVGLKKELAEKVLYIEFRNFSSESREMKAFEQHGFEFKDHYDIIAAHHTAEDAFALLSETKKRQIRHSQASGTTVRPAESLEEVSKFYIILKHLYRKKIRKPLPHISFFKSFYSQSISNFGKVLLVLKDEIVIGGVVLVTEHGKGVYEWYIAGLDKEYKKSYPSVLATWSAMEYAFKNGYGFFDFMGGGIPGKRYGVREFKLKFGASIENTGRWHYSNYNRLIAIVRRLFPTTLK